MALSRVNTTLLALGLPALLFCCSGQETGASERDGSLADAAGATSTGGAADDAGETGGASSAPSCVRDGCPAPRVCEQSLDCNPVSGRCEPVYREPGTPCGDGRACGGEKSCDGAGRCFPGAPVVCPAHAHCTEPDLLCECDDGSPVGTAPCAEVKRCPVPQAPSLAVVHASSQREGVTVNTSIKWSAEGYEPAQIQTGSSTDPLAFEPEGWVDSDSITLPTENLPRSIKLFARVKASDCAAINVYGHLVEVRQGYPPAAGQAGSTAIAANDHRLVGWATGWVDPVAYGEAVDDEWKTPERALGEPDSNATGVVCLGRGGAIAMSFEPPIRDGDGWDLAVFENAFQESFLELGYVEVSSDGVVFVRFDNAYLGEQPLDKYGTHDASSIGSLAGKYQKGWGMPFDLSALASKPAVLKGEVDLQKISQVKIVDVVGDGREADSFGNPIYDPFPGTSSAGFDLDAIGVINN